MTVAARPAELAMQTDTLRVNVLPALGGKIASLRWLPQDVELLQQPLAPYAQRNLTMGFEESDASGFDECLPSVAACEIRTARGIVSVPDHGDVWRLPWESSQSGNEIRMGTTGTSLPLRLERTLRLNDRELSLDYSLRNLDTVPLEYAWSAHPLFAVDPGDRLVLPTSVGEFQVEGSNGRRLGSKGAKHAWPRTLGSEGCDVDLSLAGSPADHIGDKLFTKAPREGWAAIERAGVGLRLEISFDPVRNPWLGLWLCYGGWPEGAGSRQQCVAIEPCTAPADSLTEAVSAGWGRRLEPGESDRWSMRIRVERLVYG